MCSKRREGIKLVKLMVAIPLGKGILLNCEQFHKTSSNYLKGYISRKFPTFQTADKFPVNSGFKMDALVKIVMQPKRQ